MINQTEIQKIAKLAKLAILPEEVAYYTEELTRVLIFMQQLQTVDTEKVEPMAYAFDSMQHWREDIITETDALKAYQALAAQIENDLYIVPAVI